MGETVAEESARAGLANVAFAAMGAEELALADGSFDVARCQFGPMFGPEPVRAPREMRRVPRPGGRLGVAVWSTPEKVAHSLVSRVVRAAAPSLPEAGRGPSPLGLGEPGPTGRLVGEAGFREIAVAAETREYVVADAEEEWRRMVEEPASLAARAQAGRPAGERGREAAIAALEGYRRDGAIRPPSEAVLVTAVL